MDFIYLSGGCAVLIYLSYCYFLIQSKKLLLKYRYDKDATAVEEKLLAFRLARDSVVMLFFLIDMYAISIYIHNTAPFHQQIAIYTVAVVGVMFYPLIYMFLSMSRHECILKNFTAVGDKICVEIFVPSRPHLDRTMYPVADWKSKEDLSAFNSKYKVGDRYQCVVFDRAPVPVAGLVIGNRITRPPNSVNKMVLRFISALMVSFILGVICFVILNKDIIDH